MEVLMTWSLLIRSSLSSLTPRTLREFGAQVQEVRAGEIVNSELFQYVLPWFSGRGFLCPWAEIGEGRPGPGTHGRAVEWHDLIARQWGRCQCEVHKICKVDEYRRNWHAAVPETMSAEAVKWSSLDQQIFLEHVLCAKPGPRGGESHMAPAFKELTI